MLNGYIGSNFICHKEPYNYKRPWDELYHLDNDIFGVKPIKVKFWNTLYPTDKIAECYKKGIFTDSICLTKER